MSVDRESFHAERYAFYKENIHKLIAKYPVVFKRNRPLPLAIGIKHEIFKDKEELGMTEDEIKWLLHVWCRRYEYSLMACKTGRRYDLNGQLVEFIEVGHLRGFANKLARNYIRLNRKLYSVSFKNTEYNEEGVVNE